MSDVVERYQSARSQQIESSPAMAVALAAKRMRAEGEAVVDLSLGEPNFDTPAHIVEAAYEAMRSGDTHYTGPSGTEPLRRAVVSKFKRENGLDYGLDQIAVGGGAKQIIFNAFLATLEPGDEVIIPAPYWVSYTDIVKLHGGHSRVVPCGMDKGFKLQPEDLEASINERTRWVLLNSPANPSGAVYTREELERLGQVLERHPRVLVMADEIYEHIIFGNDPFISLAQACPQLAERTLIVNGVSKAYAMTGWRLGYAAGPQGLISAVNKMQSQSSTCASSISQAGAVAALDGPQDFVRESVSEYNERRIMIVEGLTEIDGLELISPEGAFYAFPRCETFIGSNTPDGEVIATGKDLSRYLLESAKVATVPGVAFGMDPYIRLSFAASRESICNAIEQMKSALALLSH